MPGCRGCVGTGECRSVQVQMNCNAARFDFRISGKTRHILFNIIRFEPRFFALAFFAPPQLSRRHSLLHHNEYFDFTVSTDKAAGFFAARSRRFGARRRVAKLIRQPPRFGASAAAGHKNDLSSRAHPAAR